MARPDIYYIILNPGSGNDEKDQSRQLIETTLREAGINFEVEQLKKGDDFSRIVTELAERAQKENGALVASGGDGTVNTVAAICHKYQVPIGILPMGTFNLVARDLGISPTLPEALEVLVKGETRVISAGFVNGRIFLNNASFGLYAEVIRNRENDEDRLGRYRWVALISAVKSIFYNKKLFSIKLSLEDSEDTHLTPMVFVGQNTLQLENLGLEVAECTRRNMLAVVIMKPLTRWQTARLLLRGATRTLKTDTQLEQFCARSFEVDARYKKLEIVVDGEIIYLPTPLTFDIDKTALTVIAPPVSNA